MNTIKQGIAGKYIELLYLIEQKNGELTGNDLSKKGFTSADVTFLTKDEYLNGTIIDIEGINTWVITITPKGVNCLDNHREKLLYKKLNFNRWLISMIIAGAGVILAIIALCFNK